MRLDLADRRTRDGAGGFLRGIRAGVRILAEAARFRAATGDSGHQCERGQAQPTRPARQLDERRHKGKLTRTRQTRDRSKRPWVNIDLSWKPVLKLKRPP